MIQAHITEGPYGDSLKVFIIRRTDYGKLLLQVEGDGELRWEEIQEGAALENPRPTYELPSDTGRALLEALVRHYNGAEDTRALRRDYDAERKRVDEQSKIIAGIAQTLAEKIGECHP